MRQVRAGFVLRALFSERQGTLSLRDMARLAGADVQHVIVSLEGRYILRRIVACFVYGPWCPFFAAAWQPTLFLNRRFLDVIISLVCQED